MARMKNSKLQTAKHQMTGTIIHHSGNLMFLNTVAPELALSSAAVTASHVTTTEIAKPTICADRISKTRAQRGTTRRTISTLTCAAWCKTQGAPPKVEIVSKYSVNSLSQGHFASPKLRRNTSKTTSMASNPKPVAAIPPEIEKSALTQLLSICKLFYRPNVESFIILDLKH